MNPIMEDGSRLPFLCAVLLLFCAMYFAVAETSFASASRTRLRMAEERGDGRAKKALYVLDHFDQAISAILVGTNIVHVSTAALVTLGVTRRWGLSAVSISTLITTGVVFFAGEMLPKSVAKKFSDKLALSTAGLLVFFMKLFSPVTAFLTWLGRGVSKLAPGDVEKSVTEEELYDIIEDMTEEGSLNEEQGELISSALQFGDVSVENVLTPRVDMVALDIRSSHEEILDCIKTTTHSRLPVYEGSIDHIIGILQIRKYIKAYLREGKDLDIRPLLDEVFFIHQSMNIDELLPVMSKRKHNLAVVTDNYGGTLGLVTVEDILEELVGEIWDEDDIVEEPIVEISEGVYEVDAEESVTDVFERLGYEDPEEDEELINTLMGEWAYERFAAIPRTGDHFTYHRVSVTVASMDHNRILKLRVTLLPEAEGGEQA
ncbi:MAG: HlyC/CorC family transporter [Oscillospiraceae bacterium]|nr:HlyC/CorC family transporter [Oscillospiraceae bacterium]